MTFEAPCANPGCVHRARVTVQSDRHSIDVCFDDTDRVLAWCRIAPGSQGVCVACETSNRVYQVDTAANLSIPLCRGHLQAFLGRSLDSLSFRRVANASGGPERVFLLHHRYYDEAGEALQPVALGEMEVTEAIRSIVKLPDDPPFSLITRTQENFQQETGLPLGIDMARLMVQHALDVERDRRAAEVFPCKARRDGVRGQLLGIFQEEDPQGIAALQIERVPYAREAAYLADRLQGALSETPEGILAHLLLAFGGDFASTPETSPEDAQRYRPLARMISLEVCIPLAMERTQRHM